MKNLSMTLLLCGASVIYSMDNVTVYTMRGCAQSESVIKQPKTFAELLSQPDKDGGTLLHRMIIHYNAVSQIEDKFTGYPAAISDREFFLKQRKITGTFEEYIKNQRDAISDTITNLLAMEFEVDKTNGKGETPLFLAVHYQAVNIIKSLLEKGADPNYKNDYKETPFDLACSMNDNGKVVALLAEKSRSKALIRLLFVTKDLDDREMPIHSIARMSLSNIQAITRELKNRNASYLIDSYKEMIQSAESEQPAQENQQHEVSVVTRKFELKCSDVG